MTPIEPGGAPYPAQTPSPWRGVHWGRGVLLFTACTLAGFAALRGRASWSSTWTALATASPAWLVLGAGQTVADQVLGGLRMWASARAIGGHVRLMNCIQANAANVFLGGVTPSQSGGGPAQIYLLMRGGLSFAAATVTSACTFLGTVAVFLGLAVVVTYAPGAAAIHGAWRLFTGGTVLLFAAFLAVCVVALPRAEFIRGPVRRALERVPRVGVRMASSRTFAALERLFDDVRRLLGHAAHDGKSFLAAALGLSVLIYANKFLVAWTVARGLGLVPPVGDVLHRQELIALVTYFAPTPGASGLAELSSVHLMRDLVPDAHMGAYLVLWRTFSLYLGMLLGGAVLVRAAWQEPRQKPARLAGTPVGDER